MKQEIKVPRMGESISEATIGTIFKENGSSIKADEEILELETDKVNQVIYAPVKGVVTLQVKPQDVVKIGQVIGFVEEGGEVHKTEAPQAVKQVAQSNSGKQAFIQELETKKAAPPSVRAPASTPPPAPKPRAVSNGRETRQKLPKIRQVIAERLVQVQQQTAMLTTFNEVDLTQVVLLRERYKELFLKEHQVKLGFMPFFIKAAISALKEFPVVNGYIDGDELVFRNYFDISVAVSSDRGLVVPVIRDADHLSFAEIEKEMEILAQKARKGTISMDELTGGGFTITNGGVFGSLLSTPILNPPQTAILGMHKIVKRPVAINDQVLIRPMMYLALTYDHRVLDGREAVSFLVHIKQCLEDPARLLMEV